MLLQISYRLLRSRALIQPVKRNLAATANLDPVQKVFLDQIKKYRTQSEKLGGGAVDAGSEFEQAKNDAISRIAKLYNVENPTQFPEFKFDAPDLNQDETEFTKE